MKLDFGRVGTGWLLTLGLAFTAAGVQAQVSPVIMASGPLAFCNKDSVVLTVSPQHLSYSYQWLRGGGPAPAPSTGPQLTVKISGTYRVIAISPSGQRDTSAGTAVTVKPVVSTVTPAAPTNFCGGPSSITLTAPSGNYSYQWLQANTPLTGATASSYTVTTPGVYRVFVTNRSNNCTDTSDPRDIRIVPDPVATITPAGAATRCSGDSLLLTATTPGGAAWQWFFDNTPIAGATAARYAAQTYSGDYRVQVLDTNGCLSDTSAPVSLTVHPTPTADLTTTGALRFCEGSSVVLNTQTEPGNLLQWIVDGVLRPQDNAPFKNVSTSGSYAIQVTNAFGCTALSATLPVTVYPTPQPTLTRNGLVLRVANNQAFVYQWYRNNVALPGEVFRSLTVTAIGSYTVKVTDGVGCEAFSAPEFFAHLSVDELTTEPLRIYPNPTSGMLYLDGPMAAEATLHDAAGRLLLRTQQARQLDLSPLAKGLYFLQLTDAKGNRIRTEKITRD